MGFRFQKRIGILPGVKLNVSKSGVSTTLGERGASVNVGRKGSFVNLGLPGSGLSWRSKLGGEAPGGQAAWKSVLGGGVAAVGLALLFGLAHLLHPKPAARTAAPAARTAAAPARDPRYRYENGVEYRPVHHQGALQWIRNDMPDMCGAPGVRTPKQGWPDVCGLDK